MVVPIISGSGSNFGKRSREHLRAANPTPNPTKLYELASPSAHSASVFIHFLRSGIDPANSSTMVMKQILTALPVERVATFNTDELLDYRAARPIANFSNWVMEDIAHPEIALDMVTDLSGRRVLILHGPEPDMRWSEFSTQVTDLVKSFGVELGVDLLSVAATIPHTRPTIVHFNATSPDLLPDQGEDPGSLSLPAPLDLVLREQLARQGIPGLGLVVAVPYYLVEAEFPQASATALAHINELTGLELPVGDLEAVSPQVMAFLDKQSQDSEEVAHIIEALERGFDAGDHRPSSLLTPDSGNMPTADEIGRRVEEFLRNLTDADENEPQLPPSTTPETSLEEPNDKEPKRHRHAAPTPAPDTHVEKPNVPSLNKIEERLRRRGRHRGDTGTAQ